MIATEKTLRKLNKAAKKSAAKTAKNAPERKIYRDFTLDEFDEFTMELQVLGAGYERGKLVSELTRRAKQLRELSEVSGLVPDLDQFARFASGLEMAVRIIEGTRNLEDNVGCPECECF